jgi:hypothetical protein
VEYPKRMIFGKLVIVPESAVIVFEVDPHFSYVSGGRCFCVISVNVCAGNLTMFSCEHLCVFPAVCRDIFEGKKEEIRNKTLKHIGEAFEKRSEMSKESLLLFWTENFPDFFNLAGDM